MRLNSSNSGASSVTPGSTSALPASRFGRPPLGPGATLNQTTPSRRRPPRLAAWGQGERVHMDAISMWRRLSALLGAVLFAAGGATIGSMNAGWFGLERDANALFPLLGV